MTEPTEKKPIRIVFTDNPNAGTTVEYLQELFKAIADNFDNLEHDYDQEFASNMDVKFAKYGGRILISSKQFNWLQNIRKKAERGNDGTIDRQWNRNLR